MGHKCKVRPSAATPPGPLAHTLSAPRVNVCEWRASPPAEMCSHSLSRQELKRKLESADDSDLVMEQGKATIKSVKKELRLLQKAEEEQNQGESARATAAPSRPQTALHGPLHPTLTTQVSRRWSRSSARRTTRPYARSRSARAATLRRCKATTETTTSSAPTSEKTSALFPDSLPDEEAWRESVGLR